MTNLTDNRHRQFPIYPSHDEVFCFNCGGDFGPQPYTFKSGYAPGRGEYQISCEKCRMTTFYDICAAQVLR